MFPQVPEDVNSGSVVISPEELPLPLGGKMSTQVDNENDEMRRNYRITLKKRRVYKRPFFKKERNFNMVE